MFHQDEWDDDKCACGFKCRDPLKLDVHRIDCPMSDVSKNDPSGFRV